MTCFEYGGRLTWFLCGWTKIIWFCVRSENDLAVVGASKLLGYCVGSQTLLGFSVGDRN